MRQQRDLKGQIPEAPSPPVIDVKDWPKAFELICKHLDKHHGLMGNRLSYYVHPALQVSADDDDPSSGYASLDLEMIARAPILKFTDRGIQQTYPCGEVKALADA